MAFDTNELHMYEEVHAAELHRDMHLRVTGDLIKDYHGPHWREDRFDAVAPAPENHALEWLALVTNKIIYDNPTVKISSRHSGMDPKMMARFEGAINQWANMQDLWKTLMKVWYDSAFGYGVIRTTLGMMPGYKGFRVASGQQIKPQWPISRRVPPHRFIIDYRCEEFQQARFMGHVWKRDHKDLLKRKGFNHDAIKKIAWDVGLEKIGTPTNDYKNGPSRKEIVGYEIWVPEHTLPEARGRMGVHGTIFTMGVGVNGRDVSRPQWIKKPRPYYGPSNGPYTMFGTYHVPGSVYPLSPLAATYQQVKELNAHSVAASRSAAAYKSFIGYNPANPNAGLAAKHARNGEVVPIENMSEDIRELQVGGVKPEMYDYLGKLHERRDRVTGLSDAARGNVTGVGTATEVADASAQRDSRLSLVKKQFNSQTSEVLDIAGHFIFNSEFVRFKMSSAAALKINPRPKSLPQPSEADKIAAQIENGEIDDPFNLGLLPFGKRVDVIREQLEWNPEVTFPTDEPGDQLESMAQMTGMAYEDLQLQLDPASMERVDQALLQKQASDQATLVSQMAPVMLQTPHIEWEMLFDTWGLSLNNRNFADLIKGDVLAQMQEMTTGIMQQQAEGQQGGQSGGSQQQVGVGTGSGGAVASGPGGQYIDQGRASGRNVSKAVR